MYAAPQPNRTMRDPILIDVPGQLDTARLLLRPPRPGDGAQVFAAVTESIAELRRFPASMAWALAEPNLDASEAYCRQANANFALRKDLPYLLFERRSGDLFGASGLHRFDWAVPRFEIGYWCRSSRTGQGFVTEAVQALTAMAFDTLGARRVEIFTDDLNQPSWRVAERAGFMLEGVHRHMRIDPDGTLRDMRVYAQVR